MTDFDRRPTGSNADEWHLFLSEHLDNRANFPNGLTYVAVQIAEAIDAATPAVGGETVAVPKAALDWLFGAGPDSEGLWFGQGLRDHGSYWWRSKFRAMISAAPPASPLRQDVYCVLRDMWDEDEAPSWPQVEAAIERLLSVPASPLRGREIDQADYKLGWWLAGALEDPNVCAEMKDVINKWFKAHQPGLIMSASSASPPEQPAAAHVVCRRCNGSGRGTANEGIQCYRCYGTGIDPAVVAQPAPPFQPHENCNCLMCLAEKSR